MLENIVASIPQRFRPEKAKGVNTNFHFILSGNEPREFTVLINEEKCILIEGQQGTAQCTVKAKSENYVGLELGELNPQAAILMGKVKVSAIGEMLTFAKCFVPYKKYIQKDKNPDTQKVERKPSQGPLVGFRILDFTRLLPGPWAMAMLADMGAEVIKIESTDSPDYVRDYPPFHEGQSVNFMEWNRSKRSVVIDYKSKIGQEKIYKLVKSSDVVVEQFRPGAMAAWGLGYNQLKDINPGIVYASLTGYGQDGPMAMKAGHDLNYLAMSGILSQNKDKDGKPIIPGIQWADIASGTYQTIQAILAALLSKAKSGKGQLIDIAMTDGLLPVATIAFNQYWATGIVPQNQSESLSGCLPNYNVYETTDHKWMALAALEPKFWTKFCEIVHRPEWKEVCYPAHELVEKTKHEVAQLFKSKPQDYWNALAEAEDICLTPVLELDEVANHAHFKYRKTFDYSHNLPHINSPIKFSSTPAKIQWKAPQLGEDLL